MTSNNPRLTALDCPANKGWLITTGEGDGILCRCGGGSHTLELAEVLQILHNQGSLVNRCKTYIGVLVVWFFFVPLFFWGGFGHLNECFFLCANFVE